MSELSAEGRAWAEENWRDEPKARLALFRGSTTAVNYCNRQGGSSTRQRDSQERPAVRALELVGMAEAAELLGVSRGTARNLHRWKKLPTPSAVLACGPVWHRGDFAKWAQARRERNGR